MIGIQETNIWRHNHYGFVYKGSYLLVYQPQFYDVILVSDVAQLIVFLYLRTTGHKSSTKKWYFLYS